MASFLNHASTRPSVEEERPLAENPYKIERSKTGREVLCNLDDGITLAALQAKQIPIASSSRYCPVAQSRPSATAYCKISLRKKRKQRGFHTGRQDLSSSTTKAGQNNNHLLIRINRKMRKQTMLLCDDTNQSIIHRR